MGGTSNNPRTIIPLISIVHGNHPIKMPVAYNVAKTIINHPPVITMFIGGLTHSQIAGL